MHNIYNMVFFQYNNIYLGLPSFDRVTLINRFANRIGMNVIRPTLISANTLVSKIRAAFSAPVLAPAFA